MSSVRTTITMPEELLKRLKAEAFYQKKTISQLIQEGVSQVVPYKKKVEGQGIKKLKGKYSVKGKTGDFSRQIFYEKHIRQDMSP